MESEIIQCLNIENEDDKTKQMKIEGQTIFFNSSEHMEEIPDGSIDLIITSPPYNRGKTYSSDSLKVYNDKKSESEYLKFLFNVWIECFRVASKKAVFFLNIGDSSKDQGISEKVAKTAENAGWIRIQDIIWAKSLYGRGHYTPSGKNKRFNNIWEHIYLFVKNKKEYSLDTKSIGIPYADKSNIGRYGDVDLRDPGNILHICYEKTTGKTIKKGHEAPFPIGLPYKCIKCVPEAKTVLDPFLGTGTTLAAALNLGKKGFGYELFPRKELIRETILNGTYYKAKTPILIPHYEVAIKQLVKMLEEFEYKPKTPKTKAELMRVSILADTLKKIDLKNKYSKALLNSLQIG